MQTRAEVVKLVCETLMGNFIPRTYRVSAEYKTFLPPFFFLFGILREFEKFHRNRRWTLCGCFSRARSYGHLIDSIEEHCSSRIYTVRKILKINEFETVVNFSFFANVSNNPIQRLDLSFPSPSAERKSRTQ